MADRASELRRETINCIGAGTHNLIAGEAGYRICVVGFLLSASAATGVTFQDETTSILDVYLAQDAPVVASEMTGGWFVTEADERLDLVVLAAATVNGIVIYRMIPQGQRY